MRQGFSCSQIAAAAVAIVALAIMLVVFAAARYNDAKTRDDLEQKMTALVLMVVNASPSLILARDTNTLGYILESLRRDPDFEAGFVADDLAALASAGRTEETRLALEHWVEKSKSDPAVLKRAEQVRDEIEREAETKRNAIAAVLSGGGKTAARPCC